MTLKTKYKNKDYYLGEKLTHSGIQGNQLSVALPYWMKERLREMRADREESISGIIIGMLLEKEEFSKAEMERIKNDKK